MRVQDSSVALDSKEIELQIEHKVQEIKNKKYENTAHAGNLYKTILLSCFE